MAPDEREQNLKLAAEHRQKAAEEREEAERLLRLGSQSGAEQYLMDAILDDLRARDLEDAAGQAGHDR